MRNFAYIFLGGGIGSCLRFWVQWNLQARRAAVFPWGTLTVNLVGAFLIGLLATGYSDYFQRELAAPLFLLVGVLGGFTTFSSLTWDAYQLAAAGRFLPLISYLTASLLGGGLCVWAGAVLGKRL
jgi:fluoride exporter